jgi:hypothetical protein
MPPRAQVRPGRFLLVTSLLALGVFLASCASTHQAPSTGGPAWTASKNAEAPSKEASPEATPDFAWDPAEGDEEGDPGDEGAAVDPEAEASPEAEGDTVQAEEVEPDESAEPSQAPVQDLAVQDPELSPDEIEKERIVAEEPEITFDIPMSYNDKVLAWVDFYSNRTASGSFPGCSDPAATSR